MTPNISALVQTLFVTINNVKLIKMNQPLKTIPLYLEEPTGVDRKDWPVTRGIPFPQGLLQDQRHVVLRDVQGHPLPIQVKTLGRWPDGTVKWLLLHSQVSLPAQSHSKLTFEIYDHIIQQDPVTCPVEVRQIGRRFYLDTGTIQLNIDCEQGLSLFNHVSMDGKVVLKPGVDCGFIITNAEGKKYTSQQGSVTHAEIEEFGPLRAVLFFCGDHRDSSGASLFRYEVRITGYAGHPWLQVDYTFINDADADITDLKQIGFEIVPDLHEQVTGLVGAYTLLHESSEPFSIYQEKGCRYFFFSGSRIYTAEGDHLEFEYAGEMLKKAAHGWMDISDHQSGVTAVVKRMAMLAPKALVYTGSSIDLQLWPARAGLLHFHQGMARTHTIFLNFHVGGGCEQGVNKLATCFEDDLILTAPEWMIESGAFGDVFPYDPKKYPEINIRLRDQFNNFIMTNLSLGFFDYGDSFQRASGDRINYMANNEYDLPQVMALMFARTGEREYFEVMEACALHMMDIDFIHHTTHAPLELGGVRIHGNEHVQYNCEGMPDFSLATSHMWTEGLLSYHYLTGNPTAFSRAKSIGNCLLGLLDEGWALPPYKVEWHSVRDSAWPILALGALYDATYEEKWLAACRKIGEAVIQLQNPDGSWDLYLGWYNGNFTPLQIGIGINGLARYHKLTGDRRAEEAMSRAALALVNNCVYPEGNLFYINAPGYRWNYYATCITEGLGYVWNLTKDERILKIGERSLYKTLSSTTATGTSIAESWRGMLRYMYWADKAGILRDLRPC